MANEYRFSIPASMFLGDVDGIVDALDIPAIPDGPSGRSTMRFADGASESAAVSQTFPIPASDVWTDGSGVMVEISYFGDSAPGANNLVDWEVAFECVSESDAHDLHGGADYFAAVQATTDTIDANAGEKNIATITFTQAQADAIAAGDGCRIVLRRDSDDAVNDTYADSVWVEYVAFYEVTA